ncbi:FAD-dependent oxidoreductase, partial [Rhodopseudomonas sp. BR0M22]|uniref:FAD-dependent oxidoreductase n=1 Tax=Rhodopseudomonas sp. BR0M22 TaxID=2269369 RepID=UPI0013E04F98
MSDTPHRIVIVGGGAGGLELATALGDKYGKSDAVRVTLVDRSRTHIWKPLLHAIAAGSLRRSQHELNYLAQAHWHGFHYRLGEMSGLDRARKVIKLAPVIDDEGREINPESELGYDLSLIPIRPCP